MENIVFFETDKDLKKLTGVEDFKELWDKGWDLDDWDFGIQTEEEWREMDPDSDCYEWRCWDHYYRHCMETMMNTFQVGHYTHNGKHYYFKYH